VGHRRSWVFIFIVPALLAGCENPPLEGQTDVQVDASMADAEVVGPGATCEIAVDGQPCVSDDPCASPGVCVDGICATTDLCECAADADCADSGDACARSLCDLETQICTTVALLDAPCDDGDACTLEDQCGAGGCVGGPPPMCDDGMACNGLESCDAALGCVGGEPLTCDDGDACNGVEACDPVGGCTAGHAPECDDGNACNGLEACDANAGCVAGEALECDDDNVCNGSESCDATTGCVPGIELSCNDGNPCTGVETCVPEFGCLMGEPLVCGDGDACNGLELCDGLVGCVAGVALGCDDSNACNGLEACDGELGCVAGESLACDDDDACNGLEVCDANAGCVGGQTVACDDGNPCNGAESCDAEEGCQGGAALACDDGVACNGAEVCDGTSGCVAGMPVNCSDGNFCNGLEACDDLTGCQPSAPPACNDGDPCNGAEGCDGNLGCTEGEPLLCDDLNACTADACAIGVGCEAVAVADEVACGPSDATWCIGGQCAEKAGACAALLVQAPEWFEAAAGEAWEGTFEFGQTQVTLVEDPRYAPPTLEGRETLLLFTPALPMDDGSDVRVSATEDGVLLGTLQARDPGAMPMALDELMTQAPLEPYSYEAWSAFLPWQWVREGVTVHIAYAADGAVHEQAHTLAGLGAPQRMTLSRTKIILFGDEDDSFDTTTYAPNRLARDMYSAVPVVQMRMVDSSDWIPDYVVVGSPPHRVYGTAEYTEATNGADRWQILKNQFTLRLSAANTGRGLWRTAGGTDGSPYSLGTSIGLGWVKNDDGSFSDVNNAPYAAGWTGWTALWLGECANVFPHELGHSFTFSHFTGGTAAAWGIADEYPQDGVNLAIHPAAFDTTRRMFRTWYRVGADGPVLDGNGAIVGKRDPMNGGEGGNAFTCFPQYTGFHSWKAQAWSQNSKTVMNVDGVPGVYLWNAATRNFDAVAPGDNGQPAIAVDVPTVSLLGTLGKEADARQTYPPVYWASANSYAFPDPSDPDLPSVYNGGQYFLEIAYADQPSQRALIANGEITGNELRQYSVNVPLSDQPTHADLYFSPSAYPDIDIEGATLQHTRSIGAPEPLAPVAQVGYEFLGNGSLKITKRCQPGYDCLSRRRQSQWRVAGEALVFSTDGQAPGESYCAAPGEATTILVPAVHEDGEVVDIVVHAQRVVTSGMGEEVAVPLDDATLWADTWDMTQALRVWAPIAENQDLATGHYVATGDTVVTAWRAGVSFSQTPIKIDLEVREVIPADLAGGYNTPTLPNVPGSSSYFIVEEGAMGPTGGSWWNGTHDLWAPVIDQETGESYTLKLRAWKVACGSWWAFNAGQANWDCTYYAHIAVDEDSGNEFLESGHIYESPATAPLVVIGKRWHQPGAGTVTGVFPLQLTYTAP
jgi:hypothetical protein